MSLFLGSSPSQKLVREAACVGTWLSAAVVVAVLFVAPQLVSATTPPTLDEALAAVGARPFTGTAFDDPDTVDVCGECGDPAFNVFGLTFVGEEMWTVTFDGTLYRMSPERCQIIEQILIGSFIGAASGLGYDTRRDLLVVTDALFEKILRVTRRGVAVDTFDAPGTGAVGVAYDPSRDRYWITDWEEDLIMSIDAETGEAGPSYLYNFGSRLAGTGYDPIHDVVLYNSRGFDGAARPPSTHWMDAETGEHLRTVPAPLLSINNGEGVGVGPDGRVWIHHRELVQSVCVAKRELEPTTSVQRATWGRLKMLYR